MDKKKRARFNELKKLWKQGKLETAEKIAEMCELEALFRDANAIPCSICGKDFVSTEESSEVICPECKGDLRVGS